MKIKLFSFIGLFLLLSIVGASSARADTISLDAIANAGWYSEDLTRTHLSIRDNDSGGYYYQWSYGNGNLPWSSLNDLVTDLTDDGILNTLGINVGNWLLESGGDVFNHPDSGIYKSMYLPQGWYELTLAPESHAYNLEDFWGGSSWNAYVQIWADYGDIFNFGEGYPLYGTEEDALEYYRNCVDGMRIYLAQSADVYFFINDWNSVDNDGIITLDIQPAPVPEPGTLYLVASGLTFFLARRRWSRK
jgi:hypothetical protein